MTPLRPLTRAFPKRPSIHEIAASILTPTAICHHHNHHYDHRTHPSPAPIIRTSTTITTIHPTRALHTTPTPHLSSSPALSSSTTSSAPRTHDRGPTSSETTQTDFSTLDVLGRTPVPSTAIDACLWDGFHLDNGVKVTGGAGVLLVGGEAFAWRPWDAVPTAVGGRGGGGGGGGGEGKGRGLFLLNGKGQWEVEKGAWGLLEVVWPKPDLLILGLGPSMAPLSPATRKFINGLGIRVDVQDTRNASAQFNLLATERGVGSIAAALIPLGWREGIGVR